MAEIVTFSTIIDENITKSVDISSEMCNSVLFLIYFN